MNQQMSLGTFVILALLIATFGTQMYFSNVELRREQTDLAARFEQQTPQIRSADELRAQFDGIAGGVARLAEQGNANAVRVKEQLAAQGVNLKAPAPDQPAAQESPAAQEPPVAPGAADRGVAPAKD